MQTTTLKGARLSLQQERLWAFQQECKAYRVQCRARIEGKLDRAVFLHVFQQMVAQYEILQTVFYAPSGMDAPIQVIGHAPQIRCAVVSLEAMLPPLQEEQLTTCVTSLQEEPFDLVHGPLLRIALFSLSAESHIVVASLAALCADNVTLPILIAELCQRYEMALQGQVEAEEEPLQYTVISAWQRELLAQEGAQQPQEFWSKVNLAALEHTPLPFEALQSASERISYSQRSIAFEPRKCTRALAKTFARALSAAALDQHVSLEALMMACWYLVLARLTGERELVIGTAMDGRVYEELKGAPGLYTRFVPLSFFSAHGQPLSELLIGTHRLLQDAKEWQTYFTWPTDGEGPRFFPLLFEYESWPASIPCGNIALSLVHWEGCTEPFCLKLRVIQIGDDMQVELYYDPAHTTYEQADRLFAGIHTVLQSVLDAPFAPADALNLLTLSEQERLMKAWRGASLAVSAATLQQLFESQVQHFPDTLAVMGAESSLTYQGLNKQANQLARILRERGVGPNVPVGLCIERSVEMLVGLVAILKAGGAYLPLDIESPPERLVYQLQDTRASLVLTQQALESRLPEWGGQVLCLEALETEAVLEAATNLPVCNVSQDLVYIIYTSGSTGVPKGVLVQHQNVVNYTTALCELLAPEPGWQFATVSTLAADLGNTAIFCALASGGCIQVLDYTTITSENVFARWCIERPIDVLKIVPSHLAALLTNEAARAILPRKRLVVGGEVFPHSLIARLQELRADCKIYNHYGPTETTIGVLVNTSGYSVADKKVFLGRPIANCDVYVLDPLLHIVPVGVTGELYVGGAGVTAGYWQLPELTAQCFLPHPFAEFPGARLYRTGDLVRYTGDRQIEFVGRRDSQIKLRGYRIEAGEIEAVLRRQENVRNAVVLLREDLPGGPQLVGYIVPRKQPVPTRKELQDWLHRSVPEYMIPATFIYLKALPLTASGKVDRQQLIAAGSDDGKRILDVSARGGDDGQELVQARDEIEFQLLQIWRELLQVHDISILDNFFDLGGHSILAVRLMSHIYQQCGQDLALSLLFEHPTIAELAIVLRQRGQVTARSAIVTLQARGEKTPFFCVHPSGGTVFCYAELARCLGQEQPFYGVQTPYLHPIMDTWDTLEDMAMHYVAEIQAVQPQGPYLLGGWSLGGVVALEVAQQLYRGGQEIALLAVIDSVLADVHMRAETARYKKEVGDEEVVSAIMRGYDIPTPDGFDRLPVEAQLSYVVECAKKVNGIPSDIGLEQVRLYYRTGLMNIRLARLYVPQPYPLPLDYFISTQALRNLEQGKDAQVSKGSLGGRNDRLKLWRDIADGGIELHPVEGDHGSIIEGSGVHLLADALSKCIRRVNVREEKGS